MKCEISCRLCPFPNCVLTDQEAEEREVLDELWKKDPDATWSDDRRVVTNRRNNEKRKRRCKEDPEYAEKVRHHRREWQRKYRAANKEKMAEYERRRKQDPEYAEKLQERHRRYYQAHREKILEGLRAKKRKA